MANPADSSNVGSSPGDGDALKSESKQPAEAPRTPTVDDSSFVKAYANFCRVSPGFEELLIDFGLNPTPIGAPPQTVKIDQRIVVNYFTAKRLWAAIGAAVQRYEQIFGVLETDIQKRVQPSARAPVQAPDK